MSCVVEAPLGALEMVHPVVVGVPKVRVMRSTEDLLDLLSINLIEATKTVLLEAKGGRALEMSQSVVLEGVLIELDIVGEICLTTASSNRAQGRRNQSTGVSLINFLPHLFYNF